MTRALPVPLRMPGPDSLWGLAVPAVVWSLHFLWCYVVNAVLCARLVGSEEWLGLALIQWNIVVATVVMGAILIWSVLTSLKRLRERENPDRNPDTSAPTENEQRLFLARSTFAIGVVSLVSMVWVAMPVFFFAECR